MRPWGVELSNPIRVCGALEVPVTLPQDHQMLHVLGLTPKETVRKWIRIMNKLNKLYSVVVFLVHSDYEFGGNGIHQYEKLIKVLVEYDTVMTNYIEYLMSKPTLLNGSD